MPRKREFNENEALEAAMRLFWAQGYEATSMADLLHAMKINRFSLYAAFGSKRALFDRALTLYNETFITKLLEDLEGPNADACSIRGYFDMIVEHSAAPPVRWGCLALNSGMEFGVRDHDISDRVMALANRLQNAFERALVRAQEREQVSITDCSATAMLLVGIANGLVVFIKTGQPHNYLHTYVHTALMALGIN